MTYSAPQKCVTVVKSEQSIFGIRLREKILHQLEFGRRKIWIFIFQWFNANIFYFTFV